MSDDLLRYYNSELQHIRRQGDEFARAHPDVAAHLRFGSEGENDPYVGRLIEAFAYLNARTRLKIEDEFPELAASFLDIVLPHYQRQIPSSSIVQFDLDKSQAEQFEGYQVPSGSILETEAIQGEPCQFRTCYPVTCWPLRVQSLSLRGIPHEAPKFTFARQQQGLFKISLQTFQANVNIADFEIPALRFYINLASPFSFQLYELLFNSVIGAAIATSPQDTNAQRLAADAISPVGFGIDEGLVDYPPQSFLGYRLLSEYFAFPQKFLFLDIHIGSALKQLQGPGFEIYLYLSKRWQDLEPHIQKDSLQLGCTPIVNLFQKRAEPIRLTHFDAAYRVVPDARRPVAHEIYSIDAVTGVSDDGEQKEFQPFYSFRHVSNKHNRGFWHASRNHMETDNELELGDEMDIAFVDLDFDPLEPGNWTMDLDTTCTNRNLPARMPFGGERPFIQLEAGGAIDRVKCLIKPTPPLRPPLGQTLRWRAVSHLALNHLSLADDNQGATAFRELLRLYDFRMDEITANSIEGLLSIEANSILGRVPGDRSGALCRGTQIRLQFDESKFTAGNMYLFASVLDRFLSLYCNINSFVQTVAVSNRRQGVTYRWPARAGLQRVV
ncbi:MAG: type VI secretion system baseplate subunit TssF [bacterium]|nr:type VI secretion system baseplate subunit TssF [bacterium]